MLKSMNATVMSNVDDCFSIFRSDNYIDHIALVELKVGQLDSFQSWHLSVLTTQPWVSRIGSTRPVVMYNKKKKRCLTYSIQCQNLFLCY